MMVGRYLAALLLLSIVFACAADDEGWTFHANEAQAERLRWTTETGMLAPIRAAFASGKPEDFLAVFTVETAQERLDLLRLWLRLRHPKTGSGIRHYAVRADGNEFVFAGYAVTSEKVWDRNSAWWHAYVTEDDNRACQWSEVAGVFVHVKLGPDGQPRYRLHWLSKSRWVPAMELPDSQQVRMMVLNQARAIRNLSDDHLAYLQLLRSTTGVDDGVAEYIADLKRREADSREDADEMRRRRLLERYCEYAGLGDGSVRSQRQTRDRAWQKRLMRAFKPQVIDSGAWTTVGHAGDIYEWEWANELQRFMKEPTEMWRPLAYLQVRINDETFVCYAIRAMHQTYKDGSRWVSDKTGWLVKDGDGRWQKFSPNSWSVADYLQDHFLPNHQAFRDYSEFYERVWGLDPEIPAAWRRQLLPVLLEVPPDTVLRPPRVPPSPAEEYAFFHMPGRSPTLEPPAVAPEGWIYRGMESGLRKRAITSPIYLGPDQTRPIRPLAPVVAAVEKRDLRTAARYFDITSRKAQWATEDFLRWLYDPACATNILAYAHREGGSLLYLAGHIAVRKDERFEPTFFILRLDRSREEAVRCKLVWLTDARGLQELGDATVVHDLARRLDIERQAIADDDLYYVNWIKFLQGSNTDIRPWQLQDTYERVITSRREAISAQVGITVEPYPYQRVIGRDAYLRDAYWCDADSRAPAVRSMPLTILDEPVDIRDGAEHSRHADRVVDGFQTVFTAIRSGDREQLLAISELQDEAPAGYSIDRQYWQRRWLAPRQVLVGYVTMILDGQLTYGCISRGIDGENCRDVVTFVRQHDDGSWLVPEMPGSIYIAMAWLVCTPATKESDQAELVALYRDFWSIAPTVPTEWREKLLPVLGKAY